MHLWTQKCIRLKCERNKNANVIPKLCVEAYVYIYFQDKVYDQTYRRKQFWKE